MSAGKPQSKYSCTGKLQKKTVAFDGYSVIYFGCNTQPYALTSISVAILYVCWFLICRMASDEDVRNVCCISSVRCLKSVFVKYFFWSLRFTWQTEAVLSLYEFFFVFFHGIWCFFNLCKVLDSVRTFCWCKMVQLGCPIVEDKKRNILIHDVIVNCATFRVFFLPFSWA